MSEMSNTTNNGTFTCTLCAKQFVNKRAWGAHMAAHRRREGKPIEPRGNYECPWCDDSFKAGRFLSSHCVKTHEKTPVELYEARFPRCRTTCVDCGCDVKLKDQDKGYPERCSRCSRKKCYETNGFVSWNKGLTKDTNEKMKAASKSMKAHYAANGHHMTGLTKENSESVRLKARKISQKLKQHYETHDSWSKGLTNETHEGIAKRSILNSEIQKGKTLAPEHILALKRAKTLETNVVIDRFETLGFKLLEEYEHSMKHVLLTCLKCENQCKKTLHAVIHGSKCPTCHPPWSSKTSAWQKEIHEYVLTLCNDAVLDNRIVLDGKEIDVYVPSKQFGIECNGLYWHSEAADRFDKTHPEEKMLLARTKGITLVTLFEDEWRDKQDIVKSIISAKLGANKKVHARSLSIKHNVEGSDTFIQNNHLEGHVRCNHIISLHDKNDTMIGACSLRYAKNGSDKTTLEIARICFAPYITVVGGVARLIKHAMRVAKESNVRTLLSYSDNRLGTGVAYNRSGMTLSKVTQQRFWWTDFDQRYNRFKIRADAKNGKTENDVANENNVTRIYGCSNNRWELYV